MLEESSDHRFVPRDLQEMIQTMLQNLVDIDSDKMTIVKKNHQRSKRVRRGFFAFLDRLLQ